MTRKRLWFLYCVAGCIKNQIADLTGWSRGQIDYGLRKWSLTMFDESYWGTNDLLSRAVARAMDLPMGLAASDPVRERRVKLQDALQRTLRKGPIEWQAIDALPWPEELRDASRRAD